MEFDYSALLGKIVESYGKREAFAKAMGMSRTTLCNRLANRSPWSQNEMVRACDLLNIAPNKIKAYFFSTKVQ